MEILYPDVVGSGGAPKRIMKPRRKTDGAIDDAEMPGTGVINLQGNPQTAMSSPGQQPRPALSQTPTGSSANSIPTQQMQQATVATIVPSQTVATASSSALTPPDETAPQSQNHARKRRQGANGTHAEPAVSPSLGDAAPTSTASSPSKRRRTSSRGASLTATAPVLASSVLPGHALEAPALFQTPLEELLDALKSRAAPRWREQALDIFFRDFSSEELDLQVKISENILSNENKAMVFCKMPDRVRQHWVGKFREMHQLNKTS